MKHIIYILFTIIILAFCGCKKDDVQVQEFNIISESVIKRATKIVLTVDYNYPSNLETVEGYISESSNMSNALHVHGEINKNTFVLTFNDLHANTTYYYYYEYSNGIDHIKKSEIKVSTTNDIGLPTVMTNDVTNITTTSAICGGDVTDDGGLTVTARGVCWSKSPNPTTNDAHSNDGIGIGSYTSQLIPLSDNTTYYVRAYAINSLGTSYGEQKTFKILPEGCINGLFSVSSSKQVYFSQANLQYQASTNTWRFAENQWDYIGEANSSISSIYNGWIDLFGWGTGNNPTNASNGNGDYLSFNDWGNNIISNGGNQHNRWRTLTLNEWQYVCLNRTTPSGIRFAKAQVNGVNGVILLPNDWSSSYYSLCNVNNGGASYDSNTITIDDWNTKIEANGAVFMPAAGYRTWKNVYSAGFYGHYWSTTDYGDDGAYHVDLGVSYLYFVADNYRYNGFSVRLVCNVY